MTNHENREQPNDLDRTLDALLAKYASVEPRAGMERRVLANLRAADAQVKRPVWWSWEFAAGLAAIVIIATAFAWRLSTPSNSPVAIHPSASAQAPVAVEAVHRQQDTPPQKKSSSRRVFQQRPLHEFATANPKLDVFPSPLPLSEQEKILASYIAEHPEHAALVAEGRMEDLRQEAEERRQIAAGKRDETQ